MTTNRLLCRGQLYSRFQALNTPQINSMSAKNEKIPRYSGVPQKE
jgi:hypothetical protein